MTDKDINEIILDFSEFRSEWKKQAEGVLADYHYKRCSLSEAQQAHHFLKALMVLEQTEATFNDYYANEKKRWETYTAIKMQEARAEAWDEGYSCGLGDCGKDRERETIAANPYMEDGFVNHE